MAFLFFIFFVWLISFLDFCTQIALLCKISTQITILEIIAKFITMTLTLARDRTRRSIYIHTKLQK